MGSAERLSERVRAEPGRQMSFGAFLPLTIEPTNYCISMISYLDDRFLDITIILCA